VVSREAGQSDEVPDAIVIAPQPQPPAVLFSRGCPPTRALPQDSGRTGIDTSNSGGDGAGTRDCTDTGNSGSVSDCTRVSDGTRVSDSTPVGVSDGTRVSGSTSVVSAPL
jgi:hypothetical protein